MARIIIIFKQKTRPKSKGILGFWNIASYSNLNHILTVGYNKKIEQIN